MPTNVAENQREALTASAVRDGPYTFLPQALRHLAGTPGDHEIRLHAFKHLLALGLVGPALELIDDRPDLLGVFPEVANVQTQVASLPDGKIPWPTFRGRFEANLAAVQDRFPELVAQLQATEAELSKVDLNRCRDENYQLSTRCGSLPRRWLPELIDNRNAFDPQAVKPPADAMFAAPYVIVNVRFGELFHCVYRATNEMFLNFRPAIHVIEPNLVSLAAWLHLSDLADALRDERVKIWTGPRATERFIEHFERDGRQAPPTNVITQPAFSRIPSPQEALSVVTNLHEMQVATGVQDIERIYQSRDQAYWAERYATAGPDDPLRIVAVTSRATTVLQYSMRDIAHACEQLGHRFRLLIEADDYGLLPTSYILRSIAEFQPDLVFSLDHLRYETPDLFPESLPHCCWIQDYLPNLLCAKAGASIGSLDFVCGYWVDRCVNEYGYPADRFLNTNIPVSTRTFHDAPISKDDQARYGCDISVMSNASTPIDEFHRDALKDCPPEHRTLYERLYARVGDIIAGGENFSYHFHSAPLIRDTAADCGMDLDDEQVEEIRARYLCRLVDWGRRQQTLAWVAAWARRTGRVFKLYGRGWDQHPTLSDFAAGVVEHGDEMRRALRASKLALQITIGFSHQRSYEALACGTLPLTRYCYEDFFGEPLETYIQRRDAGELSTSPPDGSPGQFDCAAVVFPRLERIVFRSAKEFETIAERFLNNESYRHEVLADLRNVALAEYTYEAVMRRVLDMCGNKLIEQGQTRAAPATPVLV